jgi:hypothetical protein
MVSRVIVLVALVAEFSAPAELVENRQREERH